MQIPGWGVKPGGWLDQGWCPNSEREKKDGALGAAAASSVVSTGARQQLEKVDEEVHHVRGRAAVALQCCKNCNARRHNAVMLNKGSTANKKHIRAAKLSSSGRVGRVLLERFHRTAT